MICLLMLQMLLCWLCVLPVLGEEADATCPYILPDISLALLSSAVGNSTTPLNWTSLYGMLLDCIDANPEFFYPFFFTLLFVIYEFVTVILTVRCSVVLSPMLESSQLQSVHLQQDQQPVLFLLPE
jgi:hypothetical protein